MHKYLPHSNKDIESMLKVIGVKSIDDLFSDVPKEVLLKDDIKIGKSLSEIELVKYFDEIAKMNKQKICLLGGGAYDHFTPSVIGAITSREEFLTSYTPYQPEISQGTLQYIFEYQSMICELTGFEVSNASLYDGATSIVEAMFMAVSQTRKNKVAVSSCLNPNIIKVIETYAKFRNIEVVVLKSYKGRTCPLHFDKVNNGELACVVIPNINYYGLVEDATGIFDKMHEQKGLAINYVNPLSLGVFKSPVEMHADIAVGDGQTLGIPLNFGGPYLGFIATSDKYMRKLPGRIVGASKDSDGNRAYVLTLQAREQHIRREKATSNICSNQSLMALWVTIYLSLLGEKGLKAVCDLNISNSHYAYAKLLENKHFKPVFNEVFFNEFVVECDLDLKLVDKALEDNGFTSGIHIDNNRIMFAFSEKRSKQEIDNFIKVLGGL